MLVIVAMLLLICLIYLHSGTDRSFLPFAVSIRSMIDKVKSALETKSAPASLESIGIKIPSHSYVGMQFAPKDKKYTKALSYTGICLIIKINMLVCILYLTTMLAV